MENWISSVISGAEKFIMGQVVSLTNHAFSGLLQMVYDSLAINPHNIQFAPKLGNNLHAYFLTIAWFVGGALLSTEFMKGQWGEVPSNPNNSLDSVIFRASVGLLLTYASSQLFMWIIQAMGYIETGIINQVFWKTTVTVGVGLTNMGETLASGVILALFPEFVAPVLLTVLILVFVVVLQVGIELLKLWFLFQIAPLYNITYVGKMGVVKDFWLEVLSICLSQIGQIILLNLIFFLTSPFLQIGALILALTSPTIIKRFTSANNASVLLTPMTMLAPNMSSKMIGLAQKTGIAGSGIRAVKGLMGF